MIDKATYRRIYSTGYQDGRRDGELAEWQKVADWMMRHLIPTGHGYAVEDLLADLRSVVAHEMKERAARLADGYATDRTDDVARGIRALPLIAEALDS